MKLKYFKSFVFPVLMLLFSSSLFADAFFVKISYTEGEKSKDSWSKETNISIDGNDVTYKVEYSDRSNGSDKNVNKTCKLSDDAATRIQKLLSDNKMFVKDSLIDQSLKYKAYEHFVNISISAAYAESFGRISVNGDLDQIGEGDLYKRSINFINSVLEEVYKCN